MKAEINGAILVEVLKIVSFLRFLPVASHQNFVLCYPYGVWISQGDNRIGLAYPREKVLLLRRELLVHTFPTRHNLQSYDSKAEDVGLRCELTIASIFGCHIASALPKPRQHLRNQTLSIWRENSHHNTCNKIPITTPPLQKKNF